MDDDAGKLPRPQTTTIHRLSFYGSVTIRQRAGPTLPGRPRTFRCTVSAASNSCLVQQPHWEPRARVRRRARWSCTGHAQRAPRRSLRSVGWLVIGSKPGRGGAPRQQVEAQRHRSSGRHDVSGCLRPCLIAYYDLCFLGTDSRMAAGLFEWWPWCIVCWRRYLCCASRRIDFTARVCRGRELGPRRFLEGL